MEKAMAGKNSLKNAIDKLNSLEPQTRRKKGAFNAIIADYAPEIRRQMKRGLTIEQIYNFLSQELEMPVTLNTFKNYMQKADPK